MPMNCIALTNKRILCGSDSGYVFRVQADSLVQLQVGRPSSIEDLVFGESYGLLCGGEGLLARSVDHGASWELLEAPLPMRYHCAAITGDTCYIAGSGGFVFVSHNQGSEWQVLLRKNRTPIEDLAIDNGRVCLLTSDGEIEMWEADHWRPVAKSPWGDGHFVIPCDTPGESGWLLGGSAGRVCWLSEAGGLEQEAPVVRLDRYTSLTSAIKRGNQVVMAGSWGLLAAWVPGEVELPWRLEHDLFGVDAPIASEAELVLLADAEELDTLAVYADSLVDKGPRYLYSVIDTPPRSSESATRMRQLIGSFFRGKSLGVSGQAVVAVDLDPRGGFEEATVLSVIPQSMGLESNALEVIHGMSFTPGFVEEHIVPSRILQRLSFTPEQTQGRKWYLGESELGGGLDTLLAQAPRPGLISDVKTLLKRMSFPMRARRFHWEGETIVSYRLHADGHISHGETLWESPEEYEFGRHALSIVEKLEQDLSGDASLPAGYCYLLVQHLRFDQKGKQKARKEHLGPEYFVETLLALQIPEGSSYVEALPDIALLIKEYGLAVGNPGDQHLDARVILAPDGGLMDVYLNPEGVGMPQEDLDLLHDLMLLFTWGFCNRDDGRSELADTVRVNFDPAVLDTTGCRIRPLFIDVEF